MDRATAARVLGVRPGCSPAQAERAFRARARRTHPDRFPPASEAWEDASYAMAELNEARAVLTAEPPPVVTEVDADGTRWQWAPESPSTPEPAWRADPDAADRHARTWGLCWGLFLLLAAGVSLLVGARSPHNDALPFWSPALAVTGAVAIALGLRAHHRLHR